MIAFFEEEVVLAFCVIFIRFSLFPAFIVNQSERDEEVVFLSIFTYRRFPFLLRCPQDAVPVPISHVPFVETVIVFVPPE